MTTEYEFEIDYKIENVVATVSMNISERIDLVNISKKIPESEYNPERFPGLVLRINKPKATFLIFSTGKMVVTGLRNEEMADASTKKVIGILRKIGVKLPEPEVSVCNIVASGNLHINIDLNMASIIMDNAMYEPEVFPGLIYRMPEPKCVFLIFSTGKVVCTGIKSPKDVEVAMINLNIKVRELDVGKKISPSTYEELTFI